MQHFQTLMYQIAHFHHRKILLIGLKVEVVD